MKVNPELSIETILSMITEIEMKDITFCKEIVERALKERKESAIMCLFEKLSETFIFHKGNFRQEFLVAMYTALGKLSLENVIDIGKDSIVGNVIALHHFVRKHKIIQTEDLEIVPLLKKLKFLMDPFMIELLSERRDFLLLDLDETIVKKMSTNEIEKSASLLEWFFANGLVAKNKETILGMYMLYINSKSPGYKFKSHIISSFLEERIDVLEHYLRIMGKQIKSKEDIIRNYSELYSLFRKILLPVFFSIKNLKFNNVLYNGNFFPLRILNSKGEESLLFPFKQVNLMSVQKIFDLKSGVYVTPKERMGKIVLSEVFSFRKVVKITRKSAEEQVSKVKPFSEVSLEKKIREILKDQNITPHGPAEKADIFTISLLINNENDLRNSAFILKGKGYPTVNLNSVASNILKAVDLPVEIIFFVYTGKLLDEALEKIINQSNLTRKMYCILGPVELARLFIAYEKLDD